MKSLREALVHKHMDRPYKKRCNSKPALSKICYDSDGEPWEVEMIFQYKKDPENWLEALAIYDSDNFLERTDVFPTPGDIVVGVRSVKNHSETMVRKWAIDGVCYENK